MHQMFKGGRGPVGRVAFVASGLLCVAFAASAGCTGNAQVSGTGTTGGGGGIITGAGGGHSTSTSTGMGGTPGSTTSTSTGTQDPGLGAPYPVVLCHGFFGFDKLAGVAGLPYYFNVPERLEEDGETMVYTPAVDPFNSSDFRAAQLIKYVENVVETTGHEKVILIGHSQGGLDARAVASERPDLVAAVVTVATPHFGTPIADVALGLKDDPNASGIVDALVNVIASPFYDEVGDETSVVEALYLFSTPGIAAFNQAHPDQPGIFYASITGRTDGSLGGQACAPDIELPFVWDLHGDTDPVDSFFAVTEALIDGGFGKNDPNDGLVRVEDAKWGEFWGCVPADHMDEVGQLMGGGPGIGNPFDHEEMYSEIVKHLRKQGF